MPELPEVETVRRTLKKFVLNTTIENIDVLYDKIIDGDSKEFIKCVSHQTINDIDRVGKYLVFILDDYAFVSHLRMEGKYNIVDAGSAISKHDHVIFHLNNGKELRYNDTRKFGRIELVDKNSYRNDLPLVKLGPEPSKATVAEVYPKIHKSSLPIKSLLLDQSIMAGIGNIYANEICFKMQINPHTPGKNLSKKRVSELINVASEILEEAIKQGGTTIHSFDANGITGLFQVKLNVHMQSKCPICGEKIVKEPIKGRGTYWCKNCQKKRR